MTPFLYHSKIMASLPGQSAVELFRSKRHIFPSDLRSWTNDLDPAWTYWIESVTPDSKLISPRPAVPFKAGSTHGLKVIAMTEEVYES